MALAYGAARNLDSSLAYGSGDFQQVAISVPVITLVGSGVTVNLNDSYVELGYTATDDTDGDITNSVVVTGSVNTSVAGTYTLRYNVTNSVGNAAAEVVRIVIVQDFWVYTPPQHRIIDMTQGARHIIQDPDATLTYWMDLSSAIGSQTITNIVIDPDNELSGINFNCSGVNTQIQTDNNSATYPIGSLVGFCFTGGVINGVYNVTVRFTLNSGDIDDRTIVIHIEQQ